MLDIRLFIPVPLYTTVERTENFASVKGSVNNISQEYDMTTPFMSIGKERVNSFALQLHSSGEHVPL